MKIKLTPSTKTLLDVVLKNIAFENAEAGTFSSSGLKILETMGINKIDFQMFVAGDDTDIFSEDKLQYLFKRLNLYNHIISRWEYKDSIYH
jgi:hypothetical protein